MRTLYICLAITLSATLMGCVGYVGGGGGGGAVVVDSGPSIYGDFYDRGRDVHAYSQRGSQSRGIAHAGGGIARGGGGGGGGRR